MWPLPRQPKARRAKAVSHSRTAAAAASRMREVFYLLKARDVHELASLARPPMGVSTLVGALAIVVSGAHSTPIERARGPHELPCPRG